MRVLLIGAYGFIGSEIGRALLARGDAVIGFGRDITYGRRILPEADWRQGDLRNYIMPESWRSLLESVDAVVNASGLLQDEAGHKVETIQADAVMALLRASEAAGVGYFIQISAANAALNASTGFLRSKAVADNAVAVSSLRHAILRPGLVIGRNAYGGTELLRTVAALPLTSIEFERTGLIQCVGMEDLVEAVLRALDGLVPEGVHDLVESDCHTLSNIVARHRSWLGLAPPRWTIQLEPGLLGLASRVGDLLGRLGWRSPLRRNAMVSLMGGISGDVEASRAVLGRDPLPLGAVLARAPAGKQDRIAARLTLLLPAMLSALFLMWFGSALFTWTDFDHATGIMVGGGLSRTLARLLAASGAMIDACLALMLIHRGTVRPALWGMIMVTLIYLAGAVWLRPDLWIDPLAPLLKTLPAIMLALTCISLLEKR